MIAPRFIPAVLRSALRAPTRSLLTVAGAAVAMFLFCGIAALDRGVSEATSAARGDVRLIVYRQNRFCPFTSRLPEHYASRIAEIPGVVEVTPTRIVVNNCRAGLDVVTFRGIPREAMETLARDAALAGQVLAGDASAVLDRSDAALAGRELAERRRLSPGDAFDAAGITVTVAAIIDSDEPQLRNSAVVDLTFLQQAASHGGGLGVVTQFAVTVDDPDRLEEVARAIDERFAADPEPTSTRPEQAFVARVARDIVELVGFARWLGWACLVAMLAILANAVALSVQERVRDHAILQTLGFRRGLIARLILSEGILLSAAGGVVGALAALAVLRSASLAMSMEGVTIAVPAPLGLVLWGAALAVIVGAVAAAVPAWQASRQEIAASFRAGGA